MSRNRPSSPGSGDASRSAEGDTAGLDALNTALARGELAARWFLRARRRGELPTVEHAGRVWELGS